MRKPTGGLLRARVLLWLLLWPAPLSAQQLDVGRVSPNALQLGTPEIQLMALQMGGGEFAEEWVRNYRESEPTLVTFRWSTALTNQASTSEWHVLPDPDSATILAQGTTVTPKPGQHSKFTIDFRPIAGNFARRPLTYWVRVVTRDNIRFGAERPRGSTHVASPARVNFVGSGEPTAFTDLPESPYEADHDQDGLPDLREFNLAEQFKPVFVFDSDEGNRRPNEPVVLFQVRPAGCAGSQCPMPVYAWIKYVMLFAEDGGYGPSSDCSNEHHGDNQAVDMRIRSDDGQSWTLVEIVNSKYKWPGWSVEFRYDQLGRQTHPVIYLSAHKHHQYFDTHNDEENSPYSDWGCNDDVNGQGPTVWAHLLSPTNRPNNAGEPEAHSAQYFVGDLAPYGYPGEHAWDSKEFKGGLGDDGGETGPMACMWMGWNPGPEYCED